MKKYHSKKEMMESIKQLCQAFIPGYDKPRYAIIDLRSFEQHLINKKQDGTIEIVQVIAATPWGDIVIKTQDGVIGFAGSSNLDENELSTLVSICRTASNRDDKSRGSYIRAINPLWFTGVDANTILFRVLDEPIDVYLAKRK